MLLLSFFEGHLSPKTALYLLLLTLIAPLSTSSAASEIKRHPFAHIVRVTATLSFDGEIVRLDDLIDCYAGYRGDTPTRARNVRLEPSRRWVATQIPSGGMIVWLMTDPLCYAMGDRWGDYRKPTPVPPGWTPLLYWYDHRDPRQMQRGTIYLSEAALEAPDGRLRIIDPFEATIPEHPPSDDLVTKTWLQTRDHNFWLDKPPSISESVSFSENRMEWAIHIRENEWRDPQRARLSSAAGRFSGRDDIKDFDALARVLDGLTGSGLEATFATDWPGGARGDAARILRNLTDGRWRDYRDLRFGIPRRGAERHGLLLSDNALERYADNPLFPNRYDQIVPLDCVDGVVIVRTETPGLRYWVRDRCTHPDSNRGVSFLDRELSDGRIPRWGQVIFDHDEQELWIIAK
ncbi:MAG: hypothetical protein AAF416_18530 [Pseudomonadota bacterium]